MINRFKYTYLSNHLLNEFGCEKCVCLCEFAMPKHLAHNVFSIFTLPRAKQYLAQQCQRQQHRRFKYAEQIFHHFKCHHLNGMNKIFFENWYFVVVVFNLKLKSWHMNAMLKVLLRDVTRHKNRKKDCASMATTEF